MKVLITILLTYFLIKYLFRIFAPILIRRFANKMQDRFQKHPQNKDGKVTIEKNASINKKTTDNIGEYVDFEEVDE